MTPTVTIDYSKWDQAANQLVTKLGRGAADVLVEEGGLLAIECMKKTPPFVSKGHAPNDYEAGKRSIDRNLSKRVQAIDEVQWLSPAMKKRSQDLVAKADAEKLDRFIKFVFGPKWSVVKFSQDLHKGNGGLDRRGRARLGYKITQDNAELKAYRERLYLRIGYGKSGWAKAAQDLGRAANFGRNQNRVPAWVQRHVSASSPGKGVNLTNQPNPQVTIENWAKSISDYKSTMEWALRTRTEAMYRKLHKALDLAAHKAGLARK